MVATQPPSTARGRGSARGRDSVSGRGSARSRTGVRELQFYKCEYCRKDKKKCLPIGRHHPEKCQRCLEKGLPCSQPTRSRISKVRGVAEANNEPIPWSLSPEPGAVTCTPVGLEREQTCSELDQRETTTSPVQNQQTGVTVDPLMAGAMAPSISAPLVATPSTTVPTDDAMLGLMPGEQSPKRNDIESPRTSIGLASSIRRPHTERVRQKTLSDDDEDGDNRAAARYWACPFYKFDSTKYFRCFRKYDLKRFVDVKQHIVRCHSLSPLYCSNCWTSFSDNKESEYRRHLETGNCNKQPIPEDLFPHEVAALNNLVLNDPGRKASESSRWFSAWDLLFPGHSRPSSPYIEEGPAELCTMLTSMRNALEGALPSLLDSLGPRAGQETTALLAQQIHELYTRSLAAGPADSRRRLEFLASASRNNSSNVTGPSRQPDGPSELVDTRIVYI